MKKTIVVFFLLAAFLGIASLASGESLVIYFSCTGNTEKIASYVADVTGADLYRILPSIPYTEDDLKYYTDCRADLEQADPTARPAIKNMPSNLGHYDTIFIGYPIWHGQAPKIMYTFLEHAGLSGNNIVPFCTSHSSGIGTSAENLKKADKGTNTWKEGRRFSKDSKISDIAEWLIDMNLVKIKVTVGGQSRIAILNNNSSALAFYNLLDKTIQMEDYGHFEKVGPLGTTIEKNDTQITTEPGDIILYQGDKVTVYYAENTYTFTKLGHIANATEENMKAFLGDGDPEVTFERLKGNVLASHLNCSDHILTAHEKVEPTCTEEGTEAYWTCSVCNKLFSDENAGTEISEPKKIDALGHDWDEGEVTKEPTDSEEGLKVFTCKRCGEKKEETISIEIPANQNEWIKNADGSWSYGDIKQNILVVGPQEIDGIKYCFNAEGKMITGWAEFENEWYYAANSGELFTGWKQVDGAWYYFRENGAMAIGWVREGGVSYYMKSSGTMATGWIEDDGNWYYLKDNGEMLTGWMKYRKEWYYLKEDGAMATGWVNDGGTWYYMKLSGAMATGWVYDNGNWYYLKASGARASGWFQDKKEWYYLDVEGVMAIGWIQDGSTWYYMSESGVMTIGWKQISDRWFYFGSSGAMKIGWFKDKDGTWYWFDSEGAMATGRVVIDGKTEVFSDSGAWLYAE